MKICNHSCGNGNCGGHSHGEHKCGGHGGHKGGSCKCKSNKGISTEIKVKHQPKMPSYMGVDLITP